MQTSRLLFGDESLELGSHFDAVDGRADAQLLQHRLVCLQEEVTVDAARAEGGGVLGQLVIVEELLHRVYRVSEEGGKGGVDVAIKHWLYAII